VLIAGDIFDRWNPSPELISFAIKNLPHGCYAVAGQHDLPLHSYEDVKKSGYWTLVEAGVVHNVDKRNVCKTQSIEIMGFPWGAELQSYSDGDADLLQIALVHKYVWRDGHSFPGAPKDGHATEVQKQLGWFDLIVTGDNHSPFQMEKVFNCGGFFRRKSDEIIHQPSVGIIYSDGTVKRKKLDCSEDKFRDVKWKAELEDKYDLNADDYVEGIQNVEEVFDDFKDVVRRYARKNDVRKAVGMILEQLLGDE
jgi:hypothetical protein